MTIHFMHYLIKWKLFSHSYLNDPLSMLETTQRLFERRSEHKKDWIRTYLFQAACLNKYSDSMQWDPCTSVQKLQEAGGWCFHINSFLLHWQSNPWTCSSYQHSSVTYTQTPANQHSHLILNYIRPTSIHPSSSIQSDSQLIINPICSKNKI